MLLGNLLNGDEYDVQVAGDGFVGLAADDAANCLLFPEIMGVGLGVSDDEGLGIDAGAVVAAVMNGPVGRDLAVMLLVGEPVAVNLPAAIAGDDSVSHR